MGQGTCPPVPKWNLFIVCVVYIYVMQKDIKKQEGDFKDEKINFNGCYACDGA